MFWNFWYEALWFQDWTLDRKVFSFTTEWTPAEYWKGLMAQSWEWTDPQTLTVHLRPGIKWQDKEPVNGREFVADDIVYHFDRMQGWGSFTEGSPFFAGRLSTLQGVTATDKSTVVFKFNSPSTIVNSWNLIGEPMLQNFEAREAVELYGDLKDWTHAVGTGPFMLTDYQANTSMTMDKNPNYWGYDERHPKNKLPYVDTVKVVCIPDESTRLAALRTGKIDKMENISWQQAASLAKTSPELQQGLVAQPGKLLQLRCDHAPFTDINVRKALQLSFDCKTLAQTYYGGTVDWKPVGITFYKGYCTPYDEWPQSLKDEYSYNPTKAKELLAAAGYPNGFKTNVVANSSDDLQLLQVLKGYLKDINVDMDINVMDMSAYMTFVQAGKNDQMVYAGLSAAMPPAMSSVMWTAAEKNNGCHNDDSTYEALVQKLATAADVTEAQQLVNEADMRFLTQHWCVVTFPIANYVCWQPYLKGYSGEKLVWGQVPNYARWWIDLNLKKSMGR
jgi:peptide/nickel transport system substrate-binding protein